MRTTRVKIMIAVASALSMLMIVQSCSKEGNETKISQAGGTESHNMGKNCMNCHKAGGEGSGWFTAAGTVYTDNYMTTFPNAVIQLYTQPNGSGQVVATLYGDAKGNFYTTESINYGSGLYPAINSSLGLISMSTSTASGACNNCHGSANAKIYTN